MRPQYCAMGPDGASDRTRDGAPWQCRVLQKWKPAMTIVTAKHRYPAVKRGPFDRAFERAARCPRERPCEVSLDERQFPLFLMVTF